jgi:hypothetical protein
MRGGYLEIPKGWERVSADGPGPFVTSEVLRRPDGTEVRWQGSRRRTPLVARVARDQTGEPRRPRTDVVAPTPAELAAQWASVSRPGIGVTFFVGSLLFTSAAYLQYSETVNVERGVGSRARHARWRPASWEPRRIDWLAAAVQLIGTIFFNLSTFAAMKHGLDTRQVNTRVWGPDALGSICFLLSSELAYAEVCHRWICLKLRSLSWRIVMLNLLGSLAFGAAAIASLLEPSSGEPLSARVANAGTAVGGLCFLVAALALMPEAAGEEHAAPVELSASLTHSG